MSGTPSRPTPFGFTRYPHLPYGVTERARAERDALVKEAEETQARLKREMYERRANA